jgi:hypothetical protein
VVREGFNLHAFQGRRQQVVPLKFLQSNTGGGWNFAPVNPHPSCDVGLGTGWTGVLDALDARI